MAGDNLDRYHAILLTLAGVIPAELEEDMYRWRNVRRLRSWLSSHRGGRESTLPAPDSLSVADEAAPATTLIDEKIRDLIPISPLYHARGQNILTKAFSRIDDNILLDRVRIEFAGLSNQILSADGALANELDVLIRACRKAAGHMNLALERLCGKDVSLAEKLIKNNHCLSFVWVSGWYWN